MERLQCGPDGRGCRCRRRQSDRVRLISGIENALTLIFLVRPGRRRPVLAIDLWTDAQRRVFNPLAAGSGAGSEGNPVLFDPRAEHAVRPESLTCWEGHARPGGGTVRSGAPAAVAAGHFACPPSAQEAAARTGAPR